MLRSPPLAWLFCVSLALTQCSRPARTGDPPRGANVVSQPTPRTRGASRSSPPAPSHAPESAKAEPPIQDVGVPMPDVHLAGGTRSVRSTRGLVTSVEAEATRAGVRVLESGGNAVDAAVAVAFVLAVTHPSAGNLGGGGFMLVHFPGQTSKVVDFRERSPRALTQAAFDALIAQGGTGPVAAGIPGTVAGLLLALERFGTQPRPGLLARAIELARHGYRLGSAQAASLRSNWQALRLDPELRRMFTGTGGRPLSTGALVRRPDLAETLRRIAEQGLDGFYRGPTARALLDALGRPHGLWSEGDLEGYTAVLREPLHGKYRGFDIETAPPPSAGGAALLLALGMLEATRAFELGPWDPLGSHLLIEALQRAQAERRFAAGDPDVAAIGPSIASVDPPELLRRAPIERGRKTPSERVHPLYGQALRELDHTTHFSVVDGKGGIVSCTTTLSASFGAKFAAAKTGVILNNSVAAFGTVGNNLPAPGKRPTSSMAPTLVLTGGRPILVLGTPGGDTIPSTIAQVLRNLLDYRLPLDAAIDAPRLHHGFVPDEVRYEARRPPPTPLLRALERMGHKLQRNASAIGHANNVVLDGETAWGYADPREGGLALAARGARE